MVRTKSFFAMAVALTWFMVGCGENPSSPDVEMMAPEGSALSMGQGSAQKPDHAAEGRGKGDLGVVYVTSQGLYYDTFVSAQRLPNKGPFQKLYNGATEFGPGDPGYLGGRWWIDDGDGIREDEDTFLLCPLLPPGREMP